MRLTEEMFSATDTKGPVCHTCLFLEAMDPEDRTFIENKLADPLCPGTTIRKALLRAEFTNVPQVTSIRRHRNKDCKGAQS